MSTRLDAMVTGSVQRTYLDAIDGYWADLVLTEFAFLEERGGTVKEVEFHQNGDYIHYAGPWGSVYLEFMPDWYPYRWIDGHARLSGPSASFEGELDLLVRERSPLTRLPPRTDYQPPILPPLTPLDRSTIAENLRIWADVLSSATDLF